MTSLKEAAVNLLVGLVLDIVIVAVLKAFTRRRRPAYDVDDQVQALPMTKLSLSYFLIENFYVPQPKKTKNAFAQGDDSEDGGQVQLSIRPRNQGNHAGDPVPPPLSPPLHLLASMPCLGWCSGG